MTFQPRISVSPRKKDAPIHTTFVVTASTTAYTGNVAVASTEGAAPTDRALIGSTNSEPVTEPAASVGDRRPIQAPAVRGVPVRSLEREDGEQRCRRQVRDPDAHRQRPEQAMPCEEPTPSTMSAVSGGAASIGTGRPEAADEQHQDHCGERIGGRTAGECAGERRSGDEAAEAADRRSRSRSARRRTGGRSPSTAGRGR